MSTTKRFSFVLLAIPLLIIGCDETAVPVASPPTKNAVPSSAEEVSSAGFAATSSDGSSPAGGFQEFDGMKFLLPDGWVQMELSDMQKGIIAGKFGIPSAGENTTLTLSTSGGSIEDNLKRWEGQFSGNQPMVQETISADGQDATLVRLQGTFSPGFGRPTEDGWGMIGVVIPMSGHNYYIKLTGPLEEISKAEQQYLEFCKSARRS